MGTADDGYANAGEWLLDLGRATEVLVHRGQKICHIAEQMRMEDDLCILALSFAVSPNRLRLRALVEDWDIDRITDAIVDVAQRVD